MTDKILIDRAVVKEVLYALDYVAQRFVSGDVNTVITTAAGLLRTAQYLSSAALDQPAQGEPSSLEVELNLLLNHAFSDGAGKRYVRSDKTKAQLARVLALAQDDDHKPVDAVTESAINDALGLMQPAVPTGYKLMKRDPSEEMIYAARLEGSLNTDDEIADDYRAMWDAAPEAPAAQKEQP